jgi:hypothetical protein
MKLGAARHVAGATLRRLQRGNRSGASRNPEWDDIRFEIGALAMPKIRMASTITAAEFRVFSQFGEDGIIQWLLARVPIASTAFVEIGTGDYSESNTRFLLQYSNWEGVLIDSGRDHIDFVRDRGLAWRHTVQPVSAFVTADNVEALLADVPRDLGLLSLDIDGVDFWVLNAIRSVTPRIVVAEYNSIWGPNSKVSVPYDPSFRRSRAHWSWLYFGASLGAFHHLLASRDYRLVGCGSAGVNAFFVRNDVAGDLPSLEPAAAYVRSRFREARDPRGRLSYRNPHTARSDLLGELELVDVVSHARVRVADISTE